MARFAAATRPDRLDLVADGIAAHRERQSDFVTVEGEPIREGTVENGSVAEGNPQEEEPVAEDGSAVADDGKPVADENRSVEDEDQPEAGTVPGGTGPRPWIQYRARDALLNLDCTDTELDSVQAVIDDIGGARVTDRHTPDGAEGTNLKVSVPGDDERVAMAIESLFAEGFGLGEAYRLWVTEI